MKWSITSLESNADGIVISAQWMCASDEVTRSGNAVLNLDFLNNDVQNNVILDSNSEQQIVIENTLVIQKDIIPYEELTESQVLEWVWADGGVNKYLVEQSILQEINTINNPVIIKKPLPWL